MGCVSLLLIHNSFSEIIKKQILSGYAKEFETKKSATIQISADEDDKNGQNQKKNYLTFIGD